MSKKTAEQTAAEKAAQEQTAAEKAAQEQAAAEKAAQEQADAEKTAAEQAAADAAKAQTEGAAQGQPPAPEQTPQEQDGELLTLAELAEKFRLPSWQSAALHTMMGWEADKQVSEAAYRMAMDGLKTRRIGG